MKKTISRLALVWLTMIALVFIYTEKDEYTWRYSAGNLPMIFTSLEQAEADHLAAQTAMRETQQEARARSEAGIWGNPELFSDVPHVRAAQTDTPGLNLMWGDYEATVRYVSSEALDLRVMAAGRQAFIEGGRVTAQAAPQGAEVKLAFTLTDSTEAVMLACDLPEGAQIHEVTVKKSGSGVFSRDLAAYALLAGIVISYLVLLTLDERPVGVRRRRDAMILVAAALFASMPCMMTAIFDGHDLFFHLNRIEGMAGALRCGQFPVRIHTSTLLGYGYAAPQFYPELFLYVPALMRVAGVSVMASVQVFMMAINFASAFMCYRSASRLLRDRGMALLAAVLYTLSIYRLVNLYTRAAFGEVLAMVFFPLLIEAVVEVMTRNEKRWPLMALAMTGIFMSHMLSTLFAVCFCALAAVCCLPRLVREPRRILACVKAAVMTVLCTLWFVVPFLTYSAAGISTSVVLPSYRYVQTLGSLLVSFSGGHGETAKIGRALSETAGNHPGVVLLIGCVLLAIMRYAQGKPFDQEDGGDRHLALRLLAFGLFATLCSTDFFPWKWLCHLPNPYSTLFMQVQFPWRLIAVATPFLCMAAACGYLFDPRWRRAGAAAAVALSVVFAGYVINDFVSGEPMLNKQSYLDSRIGQYEYTYVGTEKDALMVGDIFDIPEEGLASYEKHGSSLTFRTKSGYGGSYVEVPLLYYPGYQAKVNGQVSTVARGDNNVIRVYGAMTGECDEVHVYFEEPVAWRIAEGVSLAGAVLLIVLLRRRKTA